MDKREFMKERLLATTTTIVLATADIDNDSPPSITVMENISHREAATMQMFNGDGKLQVIIDLGYKPTEDAIEEGKTTATARLERLLHPKFL